MVEEDGDWAEEDGETETVVDGDKIGIDELLKTTNHKKMKEYMRTDKPSRRKLYIEIYEFKDKEALKKLPCKKEEKTDEAKEGIVEFDVASKKIIQMTLKPLNRMIISLIRLKQYSVDFNASIKDIQAMMRSVSYHIYGQPISGDVTKDFERWYVVAKRDGTIIGYFKVAWSSQVDRQNCVLQWGGDIGTVGVMSGAEQEKEMETVMNALNEREEFKKLPMICICRDYGKFHIGNKWYYVTNKAGYIPMTLFEKLNSANAVTVYYTPPPMNNLGSPEVEMEWMRIFKANYEQRWKVAHVVDTAGLTTADKMAKEALDKLAMTEATNTALNIELKTERATYNSALNMWKIRQERVIDNYGQDLKEESVYGAVYGLSGNRRERGNEDDGDSSDFHDEDNKDRNPCDDCGEGGSPFCRNECEHNGEE